METSTKNEYSDNQKMIALYGKAFGHPARVAILEQLFEIDTCYCGDLVSEIGLAQSTISQHLKELKKLGLIKGTVEGTNVCYCIDSGNWLKMKKAITQFIDQDITMKTQCC